MIHFNLDTVLAILATLQALHIGITIYRKPTCGSPACKATLSVERTPEAVAVDKGTGAVVQG